MAGLTLEGQQRQKARRGRTTASLSFFSVSFGMAAMGRAGARGAAAYRPMSLVGYSSPWLAVMP